MKDHIADGVVVELPEFARQGEPPGRDGAGAFEGEVAFIAKVKLKQPAVVLGAAGGDRLNRQVRGAVIVRAVVAAAPDQFGIAQLTREHGEGGVDAGVGTNHTGDREAHSFDAPEVVSREVEI